MIYRVNVFVKLCKGNVVSIKEYIIIVEVIVKCVGVFKDKKVFVLYNIWYIFFLGRFVNDWIVDF